MKSDKWCKRHAPPVAKPLATATGDPFIEVSFCIIFIYIFCSPSPSFLVRDIVPPYTRETKLTTFDAFSAAIISFK